MYVVFCLANSAFSASHSASVPQVPPMGRIVHSPPPAAETPPEGLAAAEAVLAVRGTTAAAAIRAAAAVRERQDFIRFSLRRGNRPRTAGQWLPERLREARRAGAAMGSPPSERSTFSCRGPRS